MAKVVVSARLPGRVREILSGHEVTWPERGTLGAEALAQFQAAERAAQAGARP